MIDENFLQSAIRIRRNYLKVSNNLGLYRKRADEILKILSESLDKIDELQKQQLNGSSDVLKMINILDDLTKQSDKLEESTNPLNKEIEELAKEEQELYTRIREKHIDLTEEQIVECVRERLIRENLS